MSINDPQQEDGTSVCWKVKLTSAQCVHVLNTAALECPYKINRLHLSLCFEEVDLSGAGSLIDSQPYITGGQWVSYSSKLQTD